MSKWTKEEVLREAAGLESHGYVTGPAMLREYAAHLAAQAEWPSEEDVETAARAAWNHVPRGRSWEELTKEGRDSWKEDTRASLQSVPPPVGMVSDEDVERSRLEIMEHAGFELGSDGYLTDEAVRAALESYASRHAPTKG